MDDNTAAIIWSILQWMSYVYFTLVSIAFTCINAFRQHEQVPPVDESDEHSELLLTPAVELARRVAAGELSSETLLRAYISRAEKVNPVINAIAIRNVEAALRRARDIDSAVRSGRGAQLSGKRLLGVPFTVKDCVLVKGLPITAGLRSRWLAPDECGRSAACVERLESAGAVLLYVTNIPPMCLWWETRNNAYGRTNNPHCTLHTTAGSSGGEGALVTSCGSVIGLGTDLGGSTRMPAHCAGLFGHKPGAGVISNDGYIPDLSGYKATMNSYGALCRYAADLGPMIATMAEPDVLPTLRLDQHVDPSTISVFVLEEIKSPLVSPLDRHQRAALHDAARYLEGTIGMKCAKVDPPLVHWTVRLGFHGLTTEEALGGFSLLGTLRQVPAALRGESDATIPKLCIAAFLPMFDKIGKAFGPDSAALTSMRESLHSELTALLGDTGVLLMPTHPTVAPYHNQALLQPFNLAYTLLANTMGMPATCVPMGLAHSRLGRGPKLPVSVQVVAKRGNDRLCLAVAKALDEGFGGWKGPGM